MHLNEESQDITMKYKYGNNDEEFVLSYKGRPFSVLASDELPTASSSYIDHLLVRELDIKMTDLQCKKMSFSGVKMRMLGKISVTVQCIRDGRTCGTFHLKASVIENLNQRFDTHCVAGKNTATLLRGGICTSSGTLSETSSPSRSRRSATPSPARSDRSESPPASTRSVSPPTTPIRTLPRFPPKGTPDVITEYPRTPTKSPPGFPAKPQFARPDSPPKPRVRHGQFFCSWEQCVPIQPDCPAECGFSPQMGLPPGYQPCAPDCVGGYCPCLRRMQRKQFNFGWRNIYQNN